MDSGNDHIIRTLNLDVEFHDQVNAFEVKSTLAQVCKNKLLPALDNLFRQMHSSNKIVKADRIVIDLGVINKLPWEGALVDEVIAQLTSYFQGASTANNTSRVGVNTDSIEANTLREISEEDNIVQSIDYFFKTGLLPWYTIIKSRGEFLQHLNRLIQTPHRNYYEKILSGIHGNENKLQRLIGQTTADMQLSILLLSGIAEGGIKTLLSCWNSIFFQCDLSITADKAVYTSAMYLASTGMSSESFMALVSKDIVRRLDNAHRQKLFAAISSAASVSYATFAQLGDVKIPEVILQSITDAVNEDQRSQTAEQPASAETNKGQYIYTDVFAKRAPLFAGDGKKIADGKLLNREMEAIAAEGVFISNAGLAILHPFLLRLFENVGYVEEKKWISENHQRRAVVLMHYMVTGKQEYPEFDLLLNKIFTGFPMENALSSDIVLSEFEINESREVLQSVIHHWKALKNTSIEALQSAFLQRKGKLSYSDNRWLLLVEQNTVDILLGKLPWGFSIIRLPWMENRLHVEWN